MKKVFLSVFVVVTALTSCIKEDILDDFVPPVLRINNPVDTIGADGTYQLDVSYFNSVGMLDETIPVWWSSSDESIATISDDGLITPVTSGEFTVKIEVQEDDAVWVESKDINIGESTVVTKQVKTGEIITTSSYVLTGNFIVEEDGDDLLISIDETYETTSVLPLLVLYLTNNASTTNGALEVAPVTVFSGAHTYRVPNVGINDYSHLLYFCKPFNVKVGEGAFIEE